jgi:hypothetical protein
MWEPYNPRAIAGCILAETWQGAVGQQNGDADHRNRSGPQDVPTRIMSLTPVPKINYEERLLKVRWNVPEAPP